MKNDPSKSTNFNFKEARRFYPDVEAYCGARLIKLSDGPARGVRLLELRSGGGLEAEIIVDRGFDIGRLSMNSLPVSWHSPNGYRAPSLIDSHADRGMGFLRGISGFLSTCGFDHVRMPETETQTLSSVFPLNEIDFPLHGDGAHQPAKLVGYGLAEHVDDPYVWCKGEITQSITQRYALRLTREIRMPIGGRELSIEDQIENIGPFPTTHMMLYHFNLGYPFIAKGCEISVPNSRCIWQSEQHDPFDVISEPTQQQSCLLSIHKLSERSRTAICTVQNKHLGLKMEMEFSRENLPYVQILRMPGEGMYGIAVEPCTNGQRTRKQVRDAGEMQTLVPGERRRYDFKLCLDYT